MGSCEESRSKQRKNKYIKTFGHEIKFFKINEASNV